VSGAELLVIVPTLGRPGNAASVIEAWRRTGAFQDGADLLFAVDYDDPQLESYLQVVRGAGLSIHQSPTWRPMVEKLNSVAELHANYFGHFALGFAGDDHLPRTPGWAGTMIRELRSLGTGIVYPDDGYQGEKLPTSWAMTADIVKALGRMVPADVAHLFCDNAVLDLGRAADCIRYLPDVLVEHVHPVAGKADWTDAYRTVNSRERWRTDKAAYRAWQVADLPQQTDIVRELREAH
jgi:hypothetical protein